MLDDRFPLAPPAFTPDWWVSAFNRDAETWPTDKTEAYIYDVTLRDGEQLPGVAFSEEERVRIGVALSELGVKRIETGLPKLSPSVFRATKRLAEMGLAAQFVPQCRAEPDDVALTAETGSGALVIVHTINPYHCAHVFGLSPEALLERLVAACRYAKQQGLHTSFMASDVFRCDLSWIEEVYRVVATEAAPDVMVVTDTVGCATPWAVEHVMREVARVAPGIPLEYHGHNDFGLGTATALAAVRAGAAGVQTSFNGLGERTGNAPTEEVVAALEVALNVRTGVRLDRLLEVSQLVQDLSHVRVPANKPISGKGIFETESHVVGLIQARMQEAMGIDTGMFAFSPQLFGHGEVTYLLGKGSGPTAIEKTCARLGIPLSDQEAALVLEKVKEESRFRKAVISDATFRAFVQEIRGEAQ
jgi:methanogen homocitrate synthase